MSGDDGCLLYAGLLLCSLLFLPIGLKSCAFKGLENKLDTLNTHLEEVSDELKQTKDEVIRIREDYELQQRRDGKGYQR